MTVGYNPGQPGGKERKRAEKKKKKTLSVNDSNLGREEKKKKFSSFGLGNRECENPAPKVEIPSPENHVLKIIS
jgi:hypothetical protein